MQDESQPLEFSLLERLKDDPKVDAAFDFESRSSAATLTRDSLRRDIEALLNARRRFLVLPSGLNAASQSILNYGVPDFTNEGYSTNDHKDKLRSELEETLTRFEPRLSAIQVELLEGRENEGGSIRFKITARARISSEVEAVIFDTSVEPVDWMVKVRDLD